MIRTFARRFASAISLVSIVAMSAPALADAPATAWTDYHFETAITTVYGSPYPIAGKLDIQITPAGILRGYYHNAYQKAFIQVTGGRDGNYIWFDIGPTTVDLGIPGVESGTGRIHIIGSFAGDGSIHGQLFPNYGAGNNGFAPAAPPSAGTRNGPGDSLGGDVANQYLFAAKPVEKDANTTSPGGNP
jgi:hypothetical protein